jgi:hypothetical protein
MQLIELPPIPPIPNRPPTIPNLTPIPIVQTSRQRGRPRSYRERAIPLQEFPTIESEAVCGKVKAVREL